MNEKVHCLKYGHEIDRDNSMCPGCGTDVPANFPSARSAWKSVQVISYGRILRGPYWLMVGPSLILGALAGSYAWLGLEYGSNSRAILWFTLNLFCVAAMIWTMVRRLHDLNKSGWWALPIWLMAFIPFAGPVLILVALIVIGCLPGTPGTNRFGADPKARLKSGGDYVDETCPGCGAQLSAGQKYCPRCGMVVPEAGFCRECGTKLKAGQKFCPKCGTPADGDGKASEGRTQQEA